MCAPLSRIQRSARCIRTFANNLHQPRYAIFPCAPPLVWKRNLLKPPLVLRAFLRPAREKAPFSIETNAKPITRPYDYLGKNRIALADREQSRFTVNGHPLAFPFSAAHRPSALWLPRQLRELIKIFAATVETVGGERLILQQENSDSNFMQMAACAGAPNRGRGLPASTERVA